jgi:hypothetical protein
MTELQEAVAFVREGGWGYASKDEFFTSITDDEAAAFEAYVSLERIYYDSEYYYSNVEIALQAFVFALRFARRGLSERIDNSLPATPLEKDSGANVGEGTTCSLCFCYHDGEKWESV